MNELKINSYVPSTELFEVNFGTSNKASNSNSEDKVSFADTLSNALNEVNNKQVIAENSSNALVAGEDVDIADVMTAIKAVLNESMINSADMNNDGELTLADVLRLLKRVAI